MARSRTQHSLGSRAEQTGLLLATGAGPLTFQRTLMPRSTSDQALITGLSFAANHTLASLLQESLQSAALLLLGAAGRDAVDERRWSRATLAVDAAAIAGGLGVQRALERHGNERLPRAGARAGGFMVAATGVGGMLIGGLQELLDHRSRERRASPFVVVPAAAGLAVGGELFRRWRARADEPTSAEGELSVGKALAMSLAVIGATSAMSAGERRLADRIARAASRVLPGNESLWRPLGHVVSLAAIAGVTRYAMQRGFGMIEDREESVEPSFDLPPPSSTLSGSIDSEVPYDTMAKQGRRFVWNAQPAEMITQVMGEDAMDVIRVYVGLESAETDVKRVELAMRELDRTHAFDREWLLIDLPTGTGYVNYAAVSVLEMLSRGNCATVAMQYAARPSPLSLDRVGEGHRQARLLVDAISERLRGMPVASRPKVVLFGESLGAWTSQDAFLDQGTHGLIDAGIDYAIWIGTPHFSQWKEQVLRDERVDVASELVGVYNDIGEWEATPAERREQVRFVMITHHNDGVARFGPGLIIQSPDWLGHARATLAGDPEGHAVDAHHNVLPGARGHEELGQRGSRRVRGHRPRLPSRPPSVLPCGPRYHGHRRSDAATRRVARAKGSRAKRVGEESRHGRQESRRVLGRGLDAREPRAREQDDHRTHERAGARGLRRGRRCGRRRADRCADVGRLVRLMSRQIDAVRSLVSKDGHLGSEPLVGRSERYPLRARGAPVAQSRRVIGRTVHLRWLRNARPTSDGSM